MKNRILIFAILIPGIFFSCQKPDPLLPSTARKGINSITASFEDGRGEFTGIPDENDSKIVIPVPYFFPENSDNQVTEEMLKNMRVKANLDDNVTVTPPLLYMDLTKENEITLTDQRKEEHRYIVTAEIRKSSACYIESFSLPDLGISGIINEEKKTISIVSFEEMDSALAEVKIAPHATISPDPRTERLNYEEDITFTVTAHDGVSTCQYTIEKTVPDKIPFGIREGSEKLLFAKKLKEDVGIAEDHLTGGIAVSDGHLILNTRGRNSVMLDALSGEPMGEMELGEAKGNLVNFYTTSDKAGNILISNLAPNDGSFKVWKFNSIESAPELYLEWDEGLPVGRKISIAGDLDGDALITAPVLQTGSQFARWKVENGQLRSETPEIITISGLGDGWTTNADIVYTSPDEESDYFVTYYSGNSLSWIDGQKNEVHKQLDPISVNFIMNAVDYTEFNNARFLTTNWVNSFNWGAADMVWLLDVSSDNGFSGNLESGNVNAVVWKTPMDTYGAKAVTPVVENANGTGDVIFSVSDDGYYLYLYFLFTNGYVVGYQFDCFDI